MTGKIRLGLSTIAYQKQVKYPTRNGLSTTAHQKQVKYNSLPETDVQIVLYITTSCGTHIVQFKSSKQPWQNSVSSLKQL